MSNDQAQIKIYIGCMYSGKTSEIINESRRQMIIGRNVLCINHVDDVRYGDDDFLYSHDMVKTQCIRVRSLNEVQEKQILQANCIMINEAQFFDQLVKHVLKWCETYKKNIIVTGLDGDYKRNKFGEILDLIPYASFVTKKTALCNLCKDGTEAYFTHRLSKSTEQILIGSKEYLPLCRNHYLELNNLSNK